MDGNEPTGQVAEHGIVEQTKNTLPKDTQHKDKYGLNLREWTKQHEQRIMTCLGQGADPRRLLDWHERKLAWLQHERFIHLVVMMITIVVFLVALAFMVLVPSTIPVSTVIYLAMLGTPDRIYPVLLLFGKYSPALVLHCG